MKQGSTLGYSSPRSRSYTPVFLRCSRPWLHAEVSYVWIGTRAFCEEEPAAGGAAGAAGAAGAPAAAVSQRAALTPTSECPAESGSRTLAAYPSTPAVAIATATPRNASEPCTPCWLATDRAPVLVAAESAKALILLTTDSELLNMARSNLSQQEFVAKRRASQDLAPRPKAEREDTESR